jgi:hypothetical protein
MRTAATKVTKKASSKRARKQSAQRDPNLIAGTVESFNISPKGTYDGLLLRTEQEVLQFNFPRFWAARIAEIAPVGSEVEASGKPDGDKRPREHMVHDLAVLKANGSTLNVENGNAHGQVHVSGTVERINFAKHGEANGAILSGGDFVHLRPRGAKAVSLEIGQMLDVVGECRPSSLRSKVIEAFTVNGVDLKKKRSKKNRS